MTSSVRQQFPAILESLYEMLDLVEEQFRQTAFDEAEIGRIRLAAEEVLANIINYAYPVEQGLIEIQCMKDRDSGRIVLTFADEGLPFNPLEKEEPERSLSIAERPVGGLGVFLVRSIMDEVAYRREDDRNVLILTKRLPAGPE